MIRTKFSERKRYYINPGSHYDNEYQEEIEKKSGRKHLVKVGETNVYERIQADFEASKIENIIHKLAMGDYSVLREANLTYADADDFPANLMEAQNIVVKAKAEFDKFPTEVKELFHNSPEEYVSEMGTKEYIEKLAPYNDKINEKKKQEYEKEFNERVTLDAKYQSAVAAKMKEGQEA